MSHVYKFTDTAHLPWILQREYLSVRPHPGVPRPELLWVADLDDSDLVTTDMNAHQSGQINMVRFTLNSEDFVTWEKMQERFPILIGHEPDLPDGVTIDQCLCRDEILPLDRVQLIETKTYASVWKKFNGDFFEFYGAGDCLGVMIGETAYLSRSKIKPDGNEELSVAKVPVTRLCSFKLKNNGACK